MLYPTWLSSYTHLLREDVRPVSLLNVIGADRAARFFSTKPVVSPPQPPPQPAGSVSSVSAAGSVSAASTTTVKPAATTTVKPVTTTTVKAATAATAKPSKPITVSDKHSKAGSLTALTEP